MPPASRCPYGGPAAVACHRHGTALRALLPRLLLLTLGSPLGLNAINRCLRQPPAYPPAVARWVNLADRDDIVAARPNLYPIFNSERPANAQFDSTYTVDNGAEPHHAGFYLTKPTSGQALTQALSTTTSAP